jgi:DNA-binding LacI/PurR family transcriptional regulator
MTDQDARGDAHPRRPGVVAVARAVGVSASTVSNAFNRPERLSPALRERILGTAAELGYAGPDPVARSLRSGRVGAVGVVFRRTLAYAFDDPATGPFLTGVSEVTDARQLAVVLVPGLPEEHPSVGPAIRNVAMDGLIVYSVGADDPLFEAARKRNLPTVIVDSPALEDLPPDSGLDFVGIDDLAAAETAARHLLELGHRELGVLSFGVSASARFGPAQLELQAQATASVSKARLNGCARAVDAAGLDWATVPVEQCPISCVEHGRVGAHALLDRAPEVTALFAFSDRLALGARLAASERGLSVPRDLSIVGFDDTAAPSEGLTTIHQPHRVKGRLAADRLLRALSDDAVDGGPEILPTQLVVRDSTAPPRTRSG